MYHRVLIAIEIIIIYKYICVEDQHATGTEGVHTSWVLRWVSLYLEVRDEVRGALSQGAEENGLAALLEQQQGVEHLEEVGGRLVDGADDCALGGGDLADGPHDHLPNKNK